MARRLNYSKGDPISSSFRTSDGDVISTAGLLWGCAVYSNGADDLLAEIYDGNPGTKKLKVNCKGSVLQAGGMLPFPIECSTSIRVDITGTVTGNAEVCVLYQV